MTVYEKDSEASPALSFRHVYIVYDCCLSDRFNLNWLDALKKERTDNGGHSSISTMRHVAVKNCRKLIGAVKQHVIFVLPDSMINCHGGHLDRLSCLSKPRLITVREAQDGQCLLYGRGTYHLSSSLSASLTQTHSFVTILLSEYCLSTMCGEQILHYIFLEFCVTIYFNVCI